MNEMVLLEVFLPAVQRYFTVVLPSAYTIAQIKPLLFSMLQECVQGAVVFHEESVLYLTRCQMVLKDEWKVCEIGLIHADELIIW